MTSINQLGLFGGLLTLLILIHASSDFVLQSHAEAMAKHNHPRVRAKHCGIYTASFLPFLIWCGLPLWQLALSIVILFGSHFYLDTYHFVFLWAKHIRKPPCMTEIVRTERGTFLPVDPKAGFVKFVETPLGKILMITIDQLSHIWFLLPIAYILLKH
jgi:hypothetical protein